MPVLPNAPLIEAIFEIKWGEVKHISPGEQRYEEKLKNSELLPGQFSAAAKNDGYHFTETLKTPPLPFLPRFRYRKTVGTWPCFQLGSGIFTVNQTKDGYNGTDFTNDIKLGLRLLEASLPNGFRSLPLLSVELKYQDGLSSEASVTNDFIQSNLNIGITVSSQLLNHPNCDEESFTCNRFELENKITVPNGTLKISMDKAIIFGTPGIILTSSVLTEKGNLAHDITIELLGEWLVSAHGMLKHTFEHIFTEEAHERFKHE